MKLTCAPSSWLHRTLPVCAAGLLGVASLLLLPPPAALLAAAPELAALPPWAQRVLPSLNPLLLVLGFSAIGGALAHRAGLSRYALVRSFARAIGLTPHAYLVQRRLQHARSLIAQGTPLGEAALASGFADQSHLTRLFVRSYGLTPGAYARAFLR